MRSSGGRSFQICDPARDMDGSVGEFEIGGQKEDRVERVGWMVKSSQKQVS